MDPESDVGWVGGAGVYVQEKERRKLNAGRSFDSQVIPFYFLFLDCFFFLLSMVAPLICLSFGI